MNHLPAGRRDNQTVQKQTYWKSALGLFPDHWVRAIDRFVDLSVIRAHLGPFYSEMGRPSIDPELTILMLLIGYCFGIRSGMAGTGAVAGLAITPSVAAPFCV
jgi:transposase